MRLLIVVEGYTEEQFVKTVLSRHLSDFGVHATATIVGRAHGHQRGRGRRGGGQFSSWKRDIGHVLGGGSRSGFCVTTLFDFYGLPADFPGSSDLPDASATNRIDHLQNALGRVFDDRRLIPYLQQYEFEALVLASLPSLRQLLDAEDDLEGLELLVAEIGSRAPEDVNDGKTTAPSKRLLARIPGYSKTLHGPLAAGETGLSAIRESCPRFGAWLSCLESLAEPTAPAR